MDHPEGESLERGDRVDFNRRVRLEFRCAQISSNGGLLARELDHALGLFNLASAALLDARRSTPRWQNQNCIAFLGSDSHQNPIP